MIAKIAILALLIGICAGKPPQPPEERFPTFDRIPPPPGHIPVLRALREKAKRVRERAQQLEQQRLEQQRREQEQQQAEQRDQQQQQAEQREQQQQSQQEHDGVGFQQVNHESNGKPEKVEVEAGTGNIELSSEFDFSAFLREEAKNSQEAKNEFSETVHDFTQSFYTKLINGDQNSNQVFSPFSLHMTLAMLTSGSTPGSTTERELLLPLGRTNNVQGLELKYKTLLKEYEDLKDTFLYGNKLWTTEWEFQNIKRNFIQKLNQTYSSEFGILGSNPVQEVNRWVSEGTKNKIPKLYDSLPNDLVLLITNVMYFKDAWTVPFDEPEDEPEVKFTLVNGDKLADDDIKLMTRTSYEFGYKAIEFEGLPGRRFEAVSIPYKYDFGQRFDMVVIQPQGAAGDIRILEDYLNRTEHSATIGENIFDRINAELGKLDSNSDEVTLTMPEFKVDGDMQVNSILRQLGINGIFDLGEFNKMSNKPLKVSNVKQKAVLEVDREGTVGAVATGVDLVPLSGAFLEPVNVSVDKPFVFIIRDKKMKIPLFVGKIMDPR